MTEQKPPALALYEDLGQRVHGAESLVVFALTKAGNYVLMQSSNVKKADLVAAKKMIQEELHG